MTIRFVERASPDPNCFHCEVSELLKAREARGEVVTQEHMGQLMEVVADIINSMPLGERSHAIVWTVELLCKLTDATSLIAPAGGPSIVEH